MNYHDPFRRSPPRGSSRPATPVAGLDMPFSSSKLHALRTALAASADLLGATADQAHDLVLVAGELATNAIRHGGGNGRVRLWRHDHTLFCQVSDGGPGISDPTIGATPPDPTDVEGHRGLWICRRLAAELRLETGPRGTGTVATAALPLAQPA